MAANVYFQEAFFSPKLKKPYLNQLILVFNNSHSLLLWGSLLELLFATLFQFTTNLLHKLWTPRSHTISKDVLVSEKNSSVDSLNSCLLKPLFLYFKKYAPIFWKLALYVYTLYISLFSHFNCSLAESFFLCKNYC